MNGRCENDVVDDAVDVCEACGGEYCASCLLFVYGKRRPPYCKECAIANSGVRKGATRERLQSKSAANKRRKILRKETAEAQKIKVVTADELPDFDFEQPEEPKAAKRNFLRKRGDDELRGPVDSSSAEPDEDLTDSPDADLEPDDAEFTPDSQPASRAAQLLEQVRDGEITSTFGNGETEGGDAWNMPAEFDPEAAPTAKAPTQREEELDAVSELLTNPNDTNPFDNPHAGRVQSRSSAEREASKPKPKSTSFPAPNQDLGPMTFDEGPFASPASSDADTDNEVARERRKDSDSGPPAKAKRPALAEAVESTSDATWDAIAGIENAAPAELLATPAPLVNSDEPEAAPTKKKSRLKRAAQKVMAAPAPALDAEGIAQERVQDPTEDTDAAGQWIPPNLRGMTPEAERQTELPKRRRKAD